MNFYKFDNKDVRRKMKKYFISTGYFFKKTG